MNFMEIRKANRQGFKPLIGIYSESGCGKSMSSLLLARGIAGDGGKIVLVDSESGRGELYADVIPGGYDVLRLEPPFTPARYVEAHDAVIQSGATVGIFDSGSHEWELGVLDMAGENEEKSGKPGLHNWKKPKLEHAKFLLRLLQSPIPWIVCLRAKYKSRQIKDERGKTAIVKDDRTSPIQAEDFIFEMTAHFEILPDHSIYLSKCSHPDLRACFPDKGPITVQHGKMIAAWCAMAGKTTTQTKVEPSEIEKLKKELWKMTTKVHGHNRSALQQHLWDEGLMDPNGETLDTLTETRLTQIIRKLSK